MLNFLLPKAPWRGGSQRGTLDAVALLQTVENEDALCKSKIFGELRLHNAFSDEKVCVQVAVTSRFTACCSRGRNRVAGGEQVLPEKSVSSNIEVENNAWFAVEIRHQHSCRIFVAKVIRVFRANEQFEAILHHVPSTERYGPWARRVWVPWSLDGTPRKEVCSYSEIVANVELNKDGVLTQSSLSAWAAAGVDVGIAAPRSSGLPPRHGYS